MKRLLTLALTAAVAIPLFAPAAAKTEELPAADGVV